MQLRALKWLLLVDMQLMVLVWLLLVEMSSLAWWLVVDMQPMVLCWAGVGATQVGMFGLAPHPKEYHESDNWDR